MSVLLQNLAQLLFTAKFRPYPQLMTGAVAVPGVGMLSTSRIVILVTAVVVMVLLEVIVKYTWFGKSMRALSANEEAARLMGIILLAVGYLCCGLSYLMFGFEFHTTLYVAAAAFLVSYCRDAPPEPLAPAAAASLERPSWFRRNRPPL